MEYVYFFRSGNKVKIGRTKNILGRYEAIKVSCPDGLEILGTISTDDSTNLELLLHKRFHSKRHNGEWFSISKNEVNEVFKEYGKVEFFPKMNRGNNEKLYWDDIREEYENSDMKLKDFAKMKNIKLGTLKSRKSRENWKQNKRKAKVKTNKKTNNIIEMAPVKKSKKNNDNNPDLIISALAIVIDEKETIERKRAAELLLNHFMPNWREVVGITA